MREQLVALLDELAKAEKKGSIEVFEDKQRLAIRLVGKVQKNKAEILLEYLSNKYPDIDFHGETSQLGFIIRFDEKPYQYTSNAQLETLLRIFDDFDNVVAPKKPRKKRKKNGTGTKKRKTPVK